MKIFQQVKKIESKSGELHFTRYAIIELSWFAIYIHRIYKADKDLHLHSHPWNFATIVLDGSYEEEYLSHESNGGVIISEKKTRIKHCGSFAFGTRRYFHKIKSIVHGPITTLFLTLGNKQPWYYSLGLGDKRIDSEEYRRLKHEGKLS